MKQDRTAVAFNSSPLYRFILQEGKFKGVEFYFKNIELDHKHIPGEFDIVLDMKLLVEIIEIMVIHLIRNI